MWYDTIQSKSYCCWYLRDCRDGLGLYRVVLPVGGHKSSQGQKRVVHLLNHTPTSLIAVDLNHSQDCYVLGRSRLSTEKRKRDFLVCDLGRGFGAAGTAGAHVGIVEDDVGVEAEAHPSGSENQFQPVRKQETPPVIQGEKIPSATASLSHCCWDYSSQMGMGCERSGI